LEGVHLPPEWVFNFSGIRILSRIRFGLLVVLSYLLVVAVGSGFAQLGEVLSFAWPRESTQRKGHPNFAVILTLS